MRINTKFDDEKASKNISEILNPKKKKISLAKKREKEILKDVFG